MGEPREYHDIEGQPITLEKLVRTEPDWAVSVIRSNDKALELAQEATEKIERLKAELLDEQKACNVWAERAVDAGERYRKVFRSRIDHLQLLLFARAIAQVAQTYYFPDDLARLTRASETLILENKCLRASLVINNQDIEQLQSDLDMWRQRAIKAEKEKL